MGPTTACGRDQLQSIKYCDSVSSEVLGQGLQQCQLTVQQSGSLLSWGVTAALLLQCQCTDRSTETCRSMLLPSKLEPPASLPTQDTAQHLWPPPGLQHNQQLLQQQQLPLHMQAAPPASAHGVLQPAPLSLPPTQQLPPQPAPPAGEPVAAPPPLTQPGLI